MTADVIIAGAGIAGSALAIHLARQGREVLLLDRSTFPREKPCGEGLMPAGVQALARLGVAVRGKPFEGVCYHAAGKTVPGTFPGRATGLGIRRHHLDHALVEAARSSGARIVQAMVESPLAENGKVVGVRASGIDHRAPLTVAADGANSVLRHKLGWDASPPARRYGIRQHFRTAKPFDCVHVYLETGREVYVTPLPDDEILVAVLRDTPGRSSISFEGDPIDDPLGAAPLTVRASRRYSPGCVLLGDAAGNCDPITGGGMSQALISAELLAQHLPDLEAFDRARERMLANYRRLTAATLSLARHPAFIRPTLSLLNAWPGLFTHLLGIAGGAR
jgi:flavin-dependent dehydrogenase